MIGRGRFNEALADQNARLRAALQLVIEYLDARADVVDGDYGMPAPNREMRLIQEIQETLGSGRT